MAEADEWFDRLRPIVHGRLVVTVVPSAAAAGRAVATLRRLGARDVLVVAGRRPSGTPDTTDIVVVDLGLQPTSLLDDIRGLPRALAVPPEAVRAAIESFDPEGRALVLGDSFNELPELLGRPFLAHRRPEWVALEDKTVVDGFWDRCGIVREPSAVVTLDRTSIEATRSMLDRGLGVVVSADATHGWHGGAEFVRHLPATAGPVEVDSIVGEFGSAAATARVMPFLPGVPSSIHGIVLPDHVIVLRPVEMVVLRRPDGRFFYAGCATFHDPSPADRDAMREVAQRVGRRLRQEVGFRGAFTVDGVLGPDGFRPTELNPRAGAGLRPLTESVDLPMQLLLDAVVAGSSIEWHPDELERLLVDAADAHRAGATYRELPVAVEAEHGELAFVDGRFRRTAVGEPGDLRYEVRPGGFGTVVSGFPVAGRQRPGPSFGPVALAFWRWADRAFGLSIGPLGAAGDLGRP